MEIKIYGSDDCPYCNSLKRYLKILRIKFNYVNVDLPENEKEYEEIRKQINHTMIPVIKIGDEILSPEKDFESIPQAVKIVFGKSKK